MLPTASALCLAVLAAAPVLAHDESQASITNGSELFDWCRTESESEFVARGQTPYNFSGRHLEHGNALVVTGSWRVDGERRQVECRVVRGAQREHATLRIDAADR